jgi:1-acyl-sn-glycerol-3-phosphate acyltransferase
MKVARAIVWFLASLVARIFYRLARAGPPLPAGPLLLVANHPNSLLDPALVRAAAGRPLRFLAKSTLFDLPVLGWFVRRSGAIPVYRKIDGVDLSQNERMFAAVEEALGLGDAVCLFPEGISHSRGRLEQLRTGAARIALRSALGGVRPALVAIGLNFDRKTEFRSRVTVLFGRAFDYGDLVALAREDFPAAVRLLTGRIAAEMRRLIVEADPGEDETMVARLEELYAASRGVSRAPEARVERRRRIAAGLERLRASDPEQLAAIRERVRAYDRRLARFGLRDRDLGWTVSRATAIRFALREAALALALGPVAIAGFVVFRVPYGVTSLVARLCRSAELEALWKVLGGIVVYGLWTCGLAGLAFGVGGFGAAFATILGIPVLAVASLLALEREVAVWRLVRAYFATRQLPETARLRLRRQREEIAALLEQVAHWLGPGSA